MDDSGNWRLAPAYDLTFSQSAHGHHSISVAGESKSPGKKQLLQLANTFGVTNASHVLDQVETAVARWKYFAQEVGVSTASQTRIEKVLVTRLR
jgi:serine/threonine-protein kinase HipA